MIRALKGGRHKKKMPHFLHLIKVFLNINEMRKSKSKYYSLKEKQRQKPHPGQWKILILKLQ